MLKKKFAVNAMPDFPPKPTTAEKENAVTPINSELKRNRKIEFSTS